jgi:calcineurin-like phosphoesterase family protein
MPNIFFTSDTHWGHAGICQFTNYDGSPVRPWDDVEEMNEEMIKRWNETVGPKDKIYHLGDVVINRRFLPILDRLNGDKVLIKGNHDIFPLKDYVKYFRDIRAYHVMNGMILSHIPVHKESIARFGTNIHGHTHGNRVMKIVGAYTDGTLIRSKDEIDPDYFCVCVEQTDYRPISFEDVLQRIEEQGGQVGFRQGNGPAID